MRSEQKKQVLLGVLVAVLAVLVYRSEWWAAPGTGDAGGRATQAAGTRTSEPSAGLDLDRLTAPRSTEPVVRRNLFRFDDRRTASGESPAAPPPQTVLPPEGRPPAVLETMRFSLIGIVEGTSGSERVAVLSDGRGVYHGQAGDIIEGQFRILRVDPESVEMARLDDQGRQIIWLQGAMNSRGPGGPAIP